jgi:hypothetical protein
VQVVVDDGLASLTPMPLRRRLARWLDSPAMLERELMTVMWAGSRGFRMEPKFPDILTDDELRAIDVPVLLITGARSAMLTPAEARARGSLMPHAEVAIVPGSHGGFNRIDELNDRIAAFIEAADKQGSQPPATQRLGPTSSPDACNTGRDMQSAGAGLSSGPARPFRSALLTAAAHRHAPGAPSLPPSPPVCLPPGFARPVPRLDAGRWAVVPARTGTVPPSTRNRYPQSGARRTTGRSRTTVPAHTGTPASANSSPPGRLTAYRGVELASNGALPLFLLRMGRSV